MESEDLHGFSSDRPIKRIEEDLLGRASFSKDLADAIASWSGKDSLVVALHGDWGSGKSSIKNMAVSELENLSQNKPEIVEFSPWEWAAQDKITVSFFQEVSAAIGRKDRSKEGKKLASTLKKYGRYLNAGETLATGLSSALPTLFVLATLFGLGGNFSDEDWIKNTTTALLGVLAVWAGTLKWGKSLLNNLAGNVEIIAKGNEIGLSELRNDLTKLLSERSSSLIVVMDDLDRLTSEQLRMVFQLVKANTEFPNVVFLLLFQRDLVEEKLNDGKQTGRDYLEKIIQVPFDIPKIETSRLHNLLFSNLDRILEQDKSAKEMFDSGYWGNVFHGSLYIFFDNLRNVYRFTSTLSFHFSLLRGRTAFEVNPVDLIAIECLRLFEPDVYKEIASSKEVFTKNGSDRYGRSEDSTRQLLESIIVKSSEGKNEFVKSLIKYLFPTIEWALGGTNYSGGFGDSWLRKMRICHPSNFDKYFQFSIPSGELSNSDLQDMLSLTSDADALSGFILSLKERGIVKNALAQFESYTDEVPLENGYPYVKALLDVGDLIDHESIGFTMFSSNTHATRLVVWFLRRIDNKQERGELLLRCFRESKGISIVEHMLQADENRREKSEDDPMLDDEKFDELKKEFVKKLDDMADNTPIELMNHEHLVSFLYRWKRWGDDEKVTSWLKQQIKTPEGSLKLLKAFVSKSSSHGMGDYVAKVTNYIKLENIENFISIDEIQEAIRKLNGVSLDKNDQEAMDTFHEAIDRRERGVSDEW